MHKLDSASHECRSPNTGWNKTTLQYNKKTIQKHKLKLFGHVIRQKGIQWEILEGMAEGRLRKIESHMNRQLQSVDGEHEV